MARAFSSHADDQGSILIGDRSGQMQGQPPNHGVHGGGSYESFETDTS